MGSSVSCILRIYPPNRATQPVEVYAANIHIEAQAQYPAVLVASFIPDNKDWELFRDETNTNTPVQTRAVVEYIEDGRRLFFGSLWSVRRDFAAKVVTITAFDKLQVLNETYAIYDDGADLHYNFAITSPLLAITRVEMKAGYDYGYGFRDVWFPIFSDTDAWLSTTNSPSTTLGSAMASGASPASGSRLKLGTAHSGLLPAGFVSIDSEWIQYNGHAYDQTDGFWYIHDIQRGALGSTAAAHSAGATVYGRILKRIFFRGPLRMEGYTGTAYEIIKREQYKVNYEEGHFAFSSDPLKLRTGSDYTSIFGTYPVYDEEGGGAVDLADWINDLLVTDPDAGGPGFDAAYTDTCTPNISFANPITVTRIQIDKPTFVLDAIRDVASQLGLAKGTDQDALIWYYESNADEATFKTVAQNTTPDRLYTKEVRIDEEVNLENPKSAVLVRYESGSDFNLIGARRIWHPQAYLDDPPTYPRIGQLAGGAWGIGTDIAATYPHASNATYEAITGGPAGTIQLLLDNDATTGWGLFYDSDPGAGVYLYGWFPGVDEVTPDLYWLDKVSITFDVSGYTVDPAYFSVTVYYYDTFTGSSTTTPPTPGTAKPISERMTLEYTPGALNNPTVTITAGPDLFIQARAIGIKVDGFLKDVDNGDLFCIKVKDIYASGKMVNHELVKLVSSYTSGSFDELVAPLSTAKLRNALMGQHIGDMLDVGPATREVALNLAWLYLLQSLIMSQIREYHINTEEGLLAGVPIISETLGMSDGFEGVCDYFLYVNDGGNRSLTVRLINYLTEVLGS